MVLPARERGGFTLPELLIALVISGILVATLFQFLLGQSRFAQLHSARTQVQQNTRAGLDLIASELRGVPPFGLEVARPNAITFRAPRTWGVVCAVPSATSVELALPSGTGTDYSVGTASSRPALVLQTNPPGSNPPEWSVPLTVTAVSAAATTCGGAPLAAGIEMRGFGVPSSAGLTVGHAGYLYDRVAYAPGSSEVAGFWIRRRLGEDGASFHDLVGPIRALDGSGQGLSFRYFRADGVELLPSGSGLSAGERGAVARIEVSIESISQRRFNGVPQAKLERVEIVLRNLQ